jgi:hypothetical protein
MDRLEAVCHQGCSPHRRRRVVTAVRCPMGWNLAIARWL